LFVLGIETSCDETAAAVVQDGRRALADVVSSQVDVHAKWGGVVPELASRNHVMRIMPVIDEALMRSRIPLAQLDAIAVTSGPGLLGALLVGVQAAKALAAATGLPLVAINHLEGHLCAIRLAERSPEPPLVGLVVSGGHTSLYEVPSWGTYRLLGSTRDDAAGEAYDKVAKMLSLGYPGGVVIDRLAQTGNPRAVLFRLAHTRGSPFDFSFSGLKTAVLHHLQDHGVPEGQALADLCASFQENVADALSRKAIAAAQKTRAPLLICGGVAANSRLRALTAERAGRAGLEVYLPAPKLCTDNAAMIAAAGTLAFERGDRASAALNADPSWRLGAAAHAVP
jgi:N6-L-threonylcarbamoyladenine synthase